MDFLALGALYATLDEAKTLRQLRWLGWVCLLGFGGAIILIANIGYANLGSPQSWIGSIHSHFLFSAVGLSCLGLIYIARTVEGVRVIFRTKGLVYLGKISYGVYLYHLLVFTCCEIIAGPFIEKFLGPKFWGIVMPVMQLFLAVGFAAISFRLFENRILRLKDVFAP